MFTLEIETANMADPKAELAARLRRMAEKIDQLSLSSLRAGGPFTDIGTVTLTDCRDYKTPAEGAGFSVVYQHPDRWTWIGEDADPPWTEEHMGELPAEQLFSSEAAAWKGCCKTFAIDPY